MQTFNHLKSKQILTLLLSITLSFLLASCGSSDSSASNVPVNPSNSNETFENSTEPPVTTLSPVSYLAKTATELQQFPLFENADLISRIQDAIETDNFYTYDYPSYPEFGACFVDFDNVSCYFVGDKHDADNMILGSLTFISPNEFSYGDTSYSLEDNGGWLHPSSLLDFSVPGTSGFQHWNLDGYEDESMSVISLNKDGTEAELTAKAFTYATYSISNITDKSELIFHYPFAELAYLGIADELCVYIDSVYEEEYSSLLEACYNGAWMASELLRTDGQYLWGYFSDMTSDMFGEAFYLLSSSTSDPTDAPPEYDDEGLSSVGQMIDDSTVRNINSRAVISMATEWKNDYNATVSRDYRISDTSVRDMLASINYSGSIAIVTTEIQYWMVGQGGSPAGSVYATVTIDLNTGDILSGTIS